VSTSSSAVRSVLADIEHWAPVLLDNPATTPVELLARLYSLEVESALCSVELFGQDEAFGLLEHTQGTIPSPRAIGNLLAQDIDDDPAVFEPDDKLRRKLQSLTPIQDWGLRMLLSLAHEHGEASVDLLRDLGFPVDA
jgi:hypothetical protein